MAAPFQNYGGGTFLPDLVTRPEFLSYIRKKFSSVARSSSPA